MTSDEVVRRALQLLLAQDMAGFAGLWAEEGVLEFPFAAPGFPTRVQGRAAVAKYLSGYPDILQIKDIPRQRVHQSVDPDVVIVEFEAGILASNRRVLVDQPMPLHQLLPQRPAGMEVAGPVIPDLDLHPCPFHAALPGGRCWCAYPNRQSNCLRPGKRLRREQAVRGRRGCALTRQLRPQSIAVSLQRLEKPV